MQTASSVVGSAVGKLRLSDVCVWVRGTLQEVEEVLTRSRMFQFKPDGDVTLMAVQDAKGIPITTFQDPLHYPHHTKFLAPGTLLCFLSWHLANLSFVKHLLGNNLHNH